MYKRQVFSLLAAANYLGLDGMKEGCAKVMLENLTPQNALGLVEALTRYACSKESIEEADGRVAAAFEEVAAENEWVALEEAEVRSWLSRSDLVMKSEAAAFDALVRWTEHRPAEREGSFASLFEAVVRLPQLSAAELEAISTSPRGEVVSMKLLNETLRRAEGGAHATEPRRYVPDFVEPTMCERTLEGHTHYVMALVPFGGKLLSGGDDMTIKLVRKLRDYFL